MKNDYNNSGKFLTKTPVVILLASICGILWGSAFPCVKIGYSLFGIDSSDTGTLILFAGMRFFLAGVLAILMGSCIQRRFLRPKKGNIKKILLLSLFQTVAQYIFFYIGLANTTGVKASIVEATYVFLSIIVAVFLFKQEKLTVRMVIGCVIGFAGVVLINAVQGVDTASGKWYGDMFILLSTVAYALSSVLIKIFSQDEDPVTLSGYQFCIGSIILMVLGLCLGGKTENVSFKAVMMLVYLGFLSAAAYSLWGILLKYNPVSKVTVYGFVNPVAGVILSSILLRENNVSPIICAVSVILVSVGIILVNYKKQEAHKEK